MSGWDPGFFWMKTQVQSSKCPLTGLLSWTKAWDQKGSELHKTHTFLPQSLGGVWEFGVLSGTSLGARTNWKESVSRTLLQHSYSPELLQVLINVRLLNPCDFKQKRLLCGVLSGICLSPVYHQSIPWFWPEIWLTLCDCEKMPLWGRKDSIWKGFGLFLHTHVIPSVLPNLHVKYMKYVASLCCFFLLLFLQIALPSRVAF